MQKLILGLVALAAGSFSRAQAANQAEAPAQAGETKRVRWASAPPVRQNTYRVPRMKDNPTIDADWNKAAWKGVAPVTLEYRIPLSLLEKFSPVERPKPGVTWRANFYKCADDASHPHWLTWSPVTHAEPSFHLPAYFGVLAFE